LMSWVVRYPDQVLLLPGEGGERPVTVIGSREEFRRYEDAVRHVEFLLRTWPGLQVELRPAERRTRARRCRR